VPPLRYDQAVAYTTGTIFLLDLHRRALSDARLHVLEATATAAILGALSMARLDQSGLPHFGAPAQIGWAMLIAGAAWCAVTAGVLHYAREDCRFHVQLTFLESGLLYLALEHEPAEMLPALRRGKPWSQQAANPAGGLSFAARMQALLRAYPACARRLGYQPYPAWTQLAGTASIMLMLGLLVVATVRSFVLVNVFANDTLTDYFASGNNPDLPKSAMAIRYMILSCGVLYLLRATLGQAMRTGVMLGLVDVLHGPVQPGRATLTRG
jgi:hypothetical protein